MRSTIELIQDMQNVSDLVTFTNPALVYYDFNKIEDFKGGMDVRIKIR